MEYTIEDIFDVSATRFWDVFFDPAFDAALWPALDIDCEVLRFDRTGEGPALEIRRELRLTPRREIPRMLRSFVTSAVSYVQSDHFRARDNLIETRTTPNFMADRIDNHGVFRLDVLGESRVKRIWNGHCSAKVPLVGGKVESFLVDQIRDSYRKTTDFMRTWFARHPA